MRSVLTTPSILQIPLHKNPSRYSKVRTLIKFNFIFSHNNKWLKFSVAAAHFNEVERGPEELFTECGRWTERMRTE